MEYFAGIFDADGCVSLCPNGNFSVAIEKTNQDIINLLYQKFGGHIYRRSRNKRKISYTWCIRSVKDDTIAFIDKIIDFTHVKTSQLNKLREYLDKPRKNRKEYRAQYVHDIASFKQPISYTKEQIKVPTTIKPDEPFFKWMAGFMDGDGNFTIYEYENWKKRSFDSWIGAFNTFGEPIIYIKERIDGSISQYKGCKNPIWKWVCSQNSSIFVCDSLYPFLTNRKEQCRLVREYLTIHASKIRGIDYSDKAIADIREIIKQIKHHNSL